MSEREPLLRVRDLRKAYPGVIAVDGASFDLHEGEVLGLLGKNGAGKSTVIRMLAGTVEPDEGSIEFNGEPISISSPQVAHEIGIAVVHQELADVGMLSVAENVGLAFPYPKRAGAFVRWRELRRRAQLALDRLGVDLDPAAPVSGLSVAQRRLVMIAGALYRESKLIVLDEPTASLTNPEIDQLHEVMRTLRDQGVGLIYVSHRLPEVRAICDRVVIMRDGREVADERVASLDHARLVSLIAGAAAKAEVRESNDVSTPELGPELLSVESLTREGAVEGVSFTLRAGEILGLAGLVGSGRTEVARLIAGIDRASSGTIRVRGDEVRFRSPVDALKRGIVLLPEDRSRQGLTQNFGIRSNVTLPSLRRFRRFPALPVPSRGRERSATQRLIDEFQIAAADMEQPVRFLSGGNQQKVVLARWSLTDSDVFIFDEPTQGIDVGVKEEVFRFVRGLAAAGKGVIFISSELTELERVCSKVVVLSEGRVTASLEANATEKQILDYCYVKEGGGGNAESRALA